MSSVFNEQALRDILLNTLGVEDDAIDGPLASTLGDLGVDSVGFLELQVVVRERYGVVVPDTAAELSLAQLVNLVTGNAHEVR